MSAAPNPVHERALRLSYDDWLGVIAFPLACDTLGERFPPWVRALCQHAIATAQAIPRALIDALGRGEPRGRTAECERELASMGKDQGLCLVLEREGPMVRIIPTPFGVAVWLAYNLRRLGALPSSLTHEVEEVEA